MKTKEELAMLKTECENVKDELKELTDEELEEVTGGGNSYIEIDISGDDYEGNYDRYEW